MFLKQFVAVSSLSLPFRRLCLAWSWFSGNKYCTKNEGFLNGKLHFLCSEIQGIDGTKWDAEVFHSFYLSLNFLKHLMYLSTWAIEGHLRDELVRTWKALRYSRTWKTLKTLGQLKNTGTCRTLVGYLKHLGT